MEDDPTTSGAAEDGVEIVVGDRDAAVAAGPGTLGPALECVGRWWRPSDRSWLAPKLSGRLSHLLVGCGIGLANG